MIASIKVLNKETNVMVRSDGVSESHRALFVFVDEYVLRHKASSDRKLGSPECFCVVMDTPMIEVKKLL